MARIYLSSTFSDLKAHRRAVYDILRKREHDVRAMEHYVAADERPLDQCLADVASCDVYIGLFAWRYGFIPPGERKAITELEYRHAKQKTIPCLIFLAEEEAAELLSMKDEDPKPIQTLRKYLQINHMVDFFKEPGDLAAAVTVAVENLLDKQQARPEGPDPQVLQMNLGTVVSTYDKNIRFYWYTSGVIFLIGVVLLVAGALLGNLILSIGGSLICAFGLFPLVQRSTASRKQQVLQEQYNVLLQQPDMATETARNVQRYLNYQLAA